MVRGPTSLLISSLAGVLVGVAYFVLAPEFDVGENLRAAPRAQAIAACAAVAWCASVAGMVGVALLPAILASFGGLLLVALLAAADVGAAASGVEALAYGATGALFSAALGSRSLAATLPAFVALVGLSGAGEPVVGAVAASGEALALTLPGWGAAPEAGALSLTEPLFCGAYVALAARLGLRTTLTGFGVALALGAAVLLDGLPPLTAMGVAFYVCNADRLRELTRAD